MAVPRSLVPPDFAEQAIIPFNKALHDVELVRGTLSEFRAHSGVVMLRDDGQQIVTGDVSVLATGSTFTNSLMRATGGASAGDREAFYVRYQQRIPESRRILIVGGGPIGVEVACEISEAYSGKAITIVEAGPRLLAGTSEAAAKRVTKVLAGRGVTLITGERIQRADAARIEVFPSPGQALTDRGRRLP